MADEELEMRVDVSTTDVRCLVASAGGFRWSQRLVREKEQDGGYYQTRQTTSETHCRVCKRLLRYREKKQSTPR